MNNQFIINPAAGKGNLQQGIIDRIKAYFGENGGRYDIFVTRKPGDAEEFTADIAASGEPTRIYACGGEGTFYEVLNGAVGYDNISLGVIPCGSANDFLKQFEDISPFSDIAAQVAGNDKKTDIIKAGERYCINGCSAGMDAVVARDMSIFKNLPLVTGKAAYDLAVIKTFLRKIGVRIKLSIDNSEPVMTDCLFAVIANAPYYGGGYMAAPGALPDDGRLNFTVVDTVSKLKIPAFLNKYKVGDIKGLDYCRLGLCEKMSFSADVPIPVNLDGEIIETKSMDFSIVKDAVSFIIPRGL